MYLWQIVERLMRVFDYVDPKILSWFGVNNEQLPFPDFTVSYYQSLMNLSHRQARDGAQALSVFKEYSLIQALIIAEQAVKEGLLDWPRKYLITYITDRYENKPCRVLAYRYDSGSVEVYVNQMDAGDVWTTGVGYIFDNPKIKAIQKI